MNENNAVLPDTITFKFPSFLKILESLVNHFGSAGESIIFQIGRDFGVHYSQTVLNGYESDEMELQDLFSHVINEASKDGWANMEVDEFNPHEGTIGVILKNNVFKPRCLNIHSPQCFFLRGYISGVIKELTNMDYRFFSSQCYAKKDEHCTMRLVAHQD